MADLSKLRDQIGQADHDLVKEVGQLKREKEQAVYHEIMDQAKRLEEDF